jgi:flavin reductase (DIM6/NTAB) family NADH-FMN oxidoreductase RutF
MVLAGANSKPPDANQQRALRDAFGAFATGVTVVTALDDHGRPVGLTVNSFSSVSLAPPLVCWSLRNASPLLDCFREDRSLAIHVLRDDQEHLARQFAGRSADRFAGVPWQRGLDDVPCLANALARFECRIQSIVEAGDHRLLLARVLDYFSESGSPILFAGGRFRRLSESPVFDGNDYYEGVWL